MKITVKTVTAYLEIYKEYIQKYGLDDDTNSITVRELVDFVEQQILPQGTNV